MNPKAALVLGIAYVAFLAVFTLEKLKELFGVWADTMQLFFATGLMNLTASQWGLFLLSIVTGLFSFALISAPVIVLILLTLRGK